MAGPLDFFTPGPWTDPNQPSAAQTFQDPRAQAALLQAGLNLMSGPTWGDTAGSQIARAVGSAGEATGRIEAADIKQQDSDTKAQLREAQAGAATARSGQAASGADLARERLGIARVAEEGKNQRNVLGGRIRLSGMYQQYLKDLAKQNADPLKTTPAVEPLGMQEWIQNNPTLRTLGLVPTGADIPAPEEGGGAPGAPMTGGSVGAPEAPRDPKLRTSGTTYHTPRGDLTWDGTQWQTPTR